MLLDATAGVTDSVEIWRQFKANASTGPIPVILITSPVSGDAVSALTAGGDDFVTTPLRPEELATRIGTCMSMCAWRKQQACRLPGPEPAEQTLRPSGRKRYELVLEENAALASKLHKLTATAPSIIGDYLMTPDGKVTMPSASPRLEEITGWKCEHVIRDAKLALRTIHPDDVEPHVALIEESARTLTP